MEFRVDVAIAVVCPAGELHHGEVGHFAFIIELEKLGEPLAGGLAGDDRVERSIDGDRALIGPRSKRRGTRCFPSFAAGPVRRACRPIRSSRRRGATRAIRATAKISAASCEPAPSSLPDPFPSPPWRTIAGRSEQRIDQQLLLPGGEPRGDPPPENPPFRPAHRRGVDEFPWSNRQVSATRPIIHRHPVAGPQGEPSRFNQRASCSAAPPPASFRLHQRFPNPPQERRRPEPAVHVDGGGQPFHQSRGRRTSPRANVARKCVSTSFQTDSSTKPRCSATA